MKHIAAQKQLLESHPEQKQAEYVKVIGVSHDQCVIFVKKMVKNPAIHGYAGDIMAQEKEPKVGAAALSKDYGHISLVVAIEGDYLIVRDANYITGALTERRVLVSSMRGYIYPND